MQHGFSGELAEWEQKISLMRLVLLDKNCTQQDGILGEPRRLEKWFAYLATLTRKTNSAVVEQHGLVHQWRSSSGSKKGAFWRYGPKFKIPKNGSTDGVSPGSSHQHGLYYSSMDFRERVGAKN